MALPCKAPRPFLSLRTAGAGQPLPRAEFTTLIPARGARENEISQGLNFNIYNFHLHSAGCLREAEKDR